MWSSLWRNLAETSSNSLRIKTPDNLTQAATCARTSGDVRSRCLAHSKVLCQILKQRHPLDFGVSGQKCWHERWCLGGRRRGKVVGHATCRHHVRAGGAAHELAAAAHVPQHLQRQTAGERPSLQTTSKPAGIASGRSHVPVICSARRGQGASCECEGRVHTAQLTFGGWPCLSADSKRANMRSSADVTRVKSCEIDVVLAKLSCRGCCSIAGPESALSR